MYLACIDCVRLARCKDAPTDVEQLYTHHCPDWATTTHTTLDARRVAIRDFGPAAIRGFAKEKSVAQNIHTITAFVESGDTANIEKLRDDASTQPTVLMLAASKLTGKSQEIAGELRKLKEPEQRRAYLVDVILESMAADSISAAKAAEKAELDAQAPAEEEAPTRPRRTRKKATSAAAEDIAAAKAAEKARAEEREAEEIAAAKRAEIAGHTVDPNLVGAPVVGIGGSTSESVVDAVHQLQADFNYQLKKLHEAIEVVAIDVKALHKKIDIAGDRLSDIESTTTDSVKNITFLAKSAETTGDKVAKLEANLGRIKTSFEGFEAELIGSGTIGDTPFANNCADWE
jgi:murein L,D-transpeptidase YcbB/YkuD